MFSILQHFRFLLKLVEINVMYIYVQVSYIYVRVICVAKVR